MAENSETISCLAGRDQVMHDAQDAGGPRLGLDAADAEGEESVADAMEEDEEASAKEEEEEAVKEEAEAVKQQTAR